MKYSEMQSLSVTDLVKKKKEIASEMFTLKMKNSIGQAGNPLMIRTLRRDIARINTAISTKKTVK
jgi:large subunit ribosomal protein L29